MEKKIIFFRSVCSCTCNSCNPFQQINRRLGEDGVPGIDDGSLEFGGSEGRSTKMRWYSTDSLRTRAEYIETPTDPPQVQRKTVKKADSIHDLNRTQNLDLSPIEASGLKINELWLPQPEFPHDYVSVISSKHQSPSKTKGNSRSAVVRQSQSSIGPDTRARPGIMTNVFASAKSLLGNGSREVGGYITNTTTVQSLNNKNEIYAMNEINSIKMVANSASIGADESLQRTSI